MLLLLLKKIINRTLSTSKRPPNSTIVLTNHKLKWGKYVSLNTINILIFLIDFFIQILEDRQVEPHKRLLNITELNLNELYDLKQSILVQIVGFKITFDRKDCFISITAQQRQDFNCLFSDYELKIAKMYGHKKEFSKLSEEFEMITNVRLEINNMIEIKPYDI